MEPRKTRLFYRTKKGKGKTNVVLAIEWFKIFGHGSYRFLWIFGRCMPFATKRKKI